VATYDSYPYGRMGGMGAYPPPGASMGMGGPQVPVSMPTGHSAGLGAPKSSMPYSVNGVSLSSSSVDLLHPAMGYQSKHLYSL
jgi:hypothetical protein